MRDESAEQRATLAHVASLRINGTLRACCTKPENLTREHSVPQRGDLHVRLCRVCQRRHFRLDADAGHLGMSG